MPKTPRKTQQRDAIRGALTAADRPLSPQEIHDQASAEVEGLGIATVYRNIKQLTDEGWLKEVELPGAPSRYEVADKDHHHHFHCKVCDRVFEVEDCPGSLGHLAPDGFVHESHEIILYGRCPDCVGAPVPAAPAS
jgi:Fur family transcriptional regulator, ferric uptake regulator